MIGLIGKPGKQSRLGYRHICCQGKVLSMEICFQETFYQEGQDAERNCGKNLVLHIDKKKHSEQVSKLIMNLNMERDLTFSEIIFKITGRRSMIIFNEYDV